MSELMGDAVHRVTLPRATTPQPSVVKSARKTTPRPVPATPKAPTPYAGAVEDDVDEEPRDASFGFACIFGEGAWPVKPKGKLSLVVAPEETIATVRCAVASKLDLEVDRIRLRAVWKSKFYGAFALNHRVVLHAIGATPARLHGDAGSSPLDRAKTVAPDTLVDFHTGCGTRRAAKILERRRI